MGDKTGIEWTATINADGSVTPGATWNPTVGCDRVSPGCAHCYAKTLHDKRHAAVLAGKNLAPQYAHSFETLQLMEDRLDAPLHWRRPRRVFVNSVSDLFHQDVPDAFIDRVLAVMALSPLHTFQILTKRAERMREYLANAETPLRVYREFALLPGFDRVVWPGLPLGNVWLGVSVENPPFKKRLDQLMESPAAVRFVSLEPLLADVGDLSRWLKRGQTFHVSADVQGMLRNRSFDALTGDNGQPLSRSDAEEALWALHAKGVKVIKSTDACVGFSDQTGCPGHQHPRLDWVIVGGESGAGARPFDIAWARSIVYQCQAAGVPVFVKQLGRYPRLNGVYPDSFSKPSSLLNRKGGDPSEWPEDLRIRQFPGGQP